MGGHGHDHLVMALKQAEINAEQIEYGVASAGERSFVSLSHTRDMADLDDIGTNIRGLATTCRFGRGASAPIVAFGDGPA